MSANIPKSNRYKRVVIVGGGFGGLKLAKALDKEVFEVVLIDQYNYHQFQPLLYQVASAGIEPGAIAFPFRKDFQQVANTYFRLATMLSVNPQAKSINTSIGEIEYDYLILATGTDTNYFGMERIRKAAMPMKSIAEAMNLRNSILLNLEAALTTTDDAAIERLLTVVVVGGGATGVEVAGAISEMKRYILPKDYPDLDSSRYRILLLEGSDRLLRNMSQQASRDSLRFLGQMGVEVRLSCRVVDYDDGAVVLDSGERIETENLIWVSGVAPRPTEGLATESYGRGGRIKVDQTNRVELYDNIYAIGDMCLMSGDMEFADGHPQVAQVAMQQGRCLAINLALIERGAAAVPFRYNDKGSMATVGRNRAVVDLRRVQLSGFVAWVIWMVIHLISLLGVRNKLEALTAWTWSYVTYDQSLRLIFRPTPRNTDKS